MNELNNETKVGVLRAKIAQWHQQYYSHQVDAQVARDIGGMEPVLEAAQTNMANAQKFIDRLEKILEDIVDAEKS